MRAWLISESPPNIVRLHALTGRDFLGSGAGSVAPVRGAQVPPFQCTIQREGRVYRLRDVRPSRRGTLVNHRYVKEAVLVPGDEVQVGDTVLRFHQIAAAGPAARAAGRDSSWR